MPKSVSALLLPFSSCMARWQDSHDGDWRKSTAKADITASGMVWLVLLPFLMSGNPAAVALANPRRRA